MTLAQMKAQIEALTAQLKDARKAEGKVITYKVSDKGGLSTYGLGRFPVTLYLEQQERFDADIDNRKAFIAAHRAQFAVKGVDYVKPAPVEVPAAK